MKRRARLYQYLIAAVFFVLGGWALLFPRHVIETAFLPAFHDQSFMAAFLMSCFGAQAVLAGLFAAFSRFTRTTFLVYGIALLPFFVFNYYFSVVDPLFTPWGWIDAFANFFMLLLCFLGWRSLQPAEEEPPS